MKKHKIIIGLATLAVFGLSSCLKSEMDSYDEWREENDAYLASLDKTEYELVVPDWAPQNSVYIKWHNDRSLTKDSLVAMSNSTVSIIYQLEDINGKIIENTYSKPDSVYTSKPNSNVLGMWIAMTTMHVGDSATVVIPYPSGYGSTTTALKPYSNLIFHMKIKSIKAFERPLN